MTRAQERGAAAGPGWAKAPQWAHDPERSAAIADATARDRSHYLTGGLTEIECRTCHALVMVKKTGAHHTSVQWSEQALSRCAQIAEIRASGGNAALLPTCPRLSASIDHGVAEGIIATESPEQDPDGYW